MHKDKETVWGIHAQMRISKESITFNIINHKSPSTQRRTNNTANNKNLQEQANTDQ